MNDVEGDDALGPHSGDHQWPADGSGIVGWDLSPDRDWDDAAMTRSELVTEIGRRNVRITSIMDEIANHQAMIQRLMAERSVLEGELKGFKEAARMLRLRVPKPPANDD